MSGNILQSLGRPAEAEAHFRALLEISSASTSKSTKSSKSTASKKPSVDPTTLFRWDTLSHMAGVGDSTEVQVGDDKRGIWLKVERVSDRPAVFVVDDFLSSDECAHIITTATPKLKQAHTLTDKGRNSSSAFIDAGRDASIAALTKRASLLTGLPADMVRKSERMQVVHYGAGQYFAQHHDTTPFLRRYLTILYYLNDLELGQGGQLVFPMATSAGRCAAEENDKDDFDMDVDIDLAAGDNAGAERRRRTDQGSTEEVCAQSAGKLTIRPKRGRAVFFYNYMPPSSASSLEANGDDGLEPDITALHVACPLAEGMEKFAANHWINY